MSDRDRDNLIKTIDDRLERLYKNNGKKTELEKLFDKLSGGDLNLSIRLENYINHLLSKGKEQEKIEILTKLSKYEDIFKEFCDFLLSGKIVKKSDTVIEKGYTAFDILEKEPSLPTHTAFLWLIDFRENNDNTQNILNSLENGIPVNSINKLTYNINQIKKYLLKKADITEVVIKQLIKPYYNHPDVANEFEIWLRTKKFVENNPITEQGYTAKKLYDEFHDILDIQGIFSLLITLKENPDKALKWIKEEFPRK